MEIRTTALQSRKSGICNSLLLVIFAVVFLTMYAIILTRNREDSSIKTTKYPEVTTRLGTVRGRNMVTYRNRTVFGFLGIPFAQPPIGNLRFKAPVPANAWNGTLDASSESDPCPQLRGGKVIGNEDCLHLNLYTPMLPVSENSTLLPVIVFIVGGAFKTASTSPSDYGPFFLLDKDVLLVVPNSRLGALGYLSTGNEVCPGNNGLKDMIQALRWIQENVQYFGGDPNQVTLFGSSSGAVSVDLLTLSHSTNGLFHRYITSSGSALALCLQQPRKTYASVAVELGEYLGCPINTSEILVDCLRGLKASKLIDTDVLGHQWKTVPDLVWLPTSEPDIEGALLVDTPMNLIASGKIRDLPRMSSVAADEGLAGSIKFYENPDLFEELLDELDIALPFMLWYANSVDNSTYFTDTLKSYYINDLTANRSLLLNNLTQLMGDALFTYPLYSVIQKQSDLKKSPQYFCSIEYRGTFGTSYFFSGGSTEYTGVAHSEEIIYLFQNHNHLYGPPDHEYSDADLVMVDTMVELWTSFATNGKPTTASFGKTTIWKPYSSSKNYLRIGKGSDVKIQMEYDFLKERMEFWDKLSAATSWK